MIVKTSTDKLNLWYSKRIVDIQNLYFLISTKRINWNCTKFEPNRTLPLSCQFHVCFEVLIEFLQLLLWAEDKDLLQIIKSTSLDSDGILICSKTILTVSFVLFWRQCSINLFTRGLLLWIVVFSVYWQEQIWFCFLSNYWYPVVLPWTKRFQIYN